MDNSAELQRINSKYAKQIDLWVNGRKDENGAKTENGVRVHLLPFSYIRGRDLKDSIIILDEAQNSPFNDVVVLASRLGRNSRLIVLGDISPEQIDNPYLSPKRNGAVNFIDVMRGDEVFAYANLPNSVRSYAVQRLLRRLKEYKER